ncbi:MAG: hypothetical protein EBR86_07425 [Planctomycetia bacterium]|nr:hypothetical protein [Planctomycetia bacterium]
MPVQMVAAIDLGDLLEYLVPILFAVFWILSRLAAVIRRLAGPPVKPPAFPPEIVRELSRRAPRPAVPPAAPPRPLPAAGGPADPREELARQIEEFLSVRGTPAAQRNMAPRQAAAKPPAQRPPAQKPVTQAPGPRRPATPRAAPPRPDKPAAPSAPRPVAQPVPTVGGVIGSTTVGGLAARSTDVVRHLDGSFPHPARLPLPAAPVAPTAPVAAELVAALRDPGSLRRMILLREILDRPVARW